MQHLITKIFSFKVLSQYVKFYWKMNRVKHILTVFLSFYHLSSHITKTAQYRHPNAPKYLLYDPTPPLPRQLPIPSYSSGYPGASDHDTQQGYQQANLWVPPNPYLNTGGLFSHWFNNANFANQHLTMDIINSGLETKQPIRVHFYDLTWWIWCLAPPLPFTDTRNSIEIRYGDFFGYLKTTFYSGGLGVCCRHCSLGQNIVCTMSVEFQSPDLTVNRITCKNTPIVYISGCKAQNMN